MVKFTKLISVVLPILGTLEYLKKTDIMEMDYDYLIGNIRLQKLWCKCGSPDNIIFMHENTFEGIQQLRGQIFGILGPSYHTMASLGKIFPKILKECIFYGIWQFLMLMALKDIKKAIRIEKGQQRSQRSFWRPESPGAKNWWFFLIIRTIWYL